ncbi:hypothetical protein ABZP36_020306 [Zizania latifolia]
MEADHHFALCPSSSTHFSAYPTRARAMRFFTNLYPRCSLLLLLLLVTASHGLKFGDLLGGQGKAPAVRASVKLAKTKSEFFCSCGCPGERPCDVLDACCMVHDHCVDANNDDYLNTKCNENLLSCIDRVNPAGPTFPGNSCNVGQTASVIRGVIETAVLAGKILHKRDDGR